MKASREPSAGRMPHCASSCSHISAPVPSLCALKLARFSNWSQKTPPSSLARRRATLTKCSGCVIETGRIGSTCAPSARRALTFSSAASSGSATTHLSPLARATIASDTPVEPAVPSVTTPASSRSAPSPSAASASSTMRAATRSFVLPPGFRSSILARTSQPVAALSESKRTSGVFPMHARTPLAPAPSRARGRAAAARCAPPFRCLSRSAAWHSSSTAHAAAAAPAQSAATQA